MKNITTITLMLALIGCGQPTKKEKELPDASKIIETKGATQNNNQQPEKLPETTPIVEAPRALSLDQWKQVNDPSQKETLYGIAFGNGTYVAIGNAATILTSTDAVLWEKQTIEKLDGAQQIAFGAGRFILRSRSATYQSTDGKAWTVVEKAPPDGVYLYFVNNEFTQVSFGERFFISKDGLTWVENVVEGLPAGLSTHGAGVYVMADFHKETEDGKEQLFSFTSTDGKTWARHPSDFSSGLVTGLLYAKGLFLLVHDNGQLLTSTDGKVWEKGEKLPDERSFGHPVYCGERFLLIAGAAHRGAAVFSSPDAKRWTKHAFAFPKGINELVCGDGVVVGVGMDGAIFIAKS